MKKIKILLSCVVLIIIILLGNESKAVFQSNENTPAEFNFEKWFTEIRDMEKLGGGMGLNETINEDLTSTVSNNIDIHMQKNTEYGAIAILSASPYGNPNIVQDKESTTGNKSGVYVNKINSENTAASTPIFQVTKFHSAAQRYKNVYEFSNFIPKSGDATIETKNWHNSGYIFGTHSGVSMVRGGYNHWTWAYEGIFRVVMNYDSADALSSYYSDPYTSRAAIVCGQGL